MRDVYYRIIRKSNYMPNRTVQECSSMAEARVAIGELLDEYYRAGWDIDGYTASTVRRERQDVDGGLLFVRFEVERGVVTWEGVE